MLKLLRHDFDLSLPGAVEELIAFNRSVFGDLRMEGEPDAPQDPPAPTPTAPTASQPSASEKGFPESTPVAEMTTEQQVAYWRFQSRKHQERAEARADRDELKAKADEFDRLQAESQTEQERAVAAARSEGAAEALRSANEKAARAILRASLTERGRTAEEVDALVSATNLSAFIVNDEVDTGRVGAHVDIVAPKKLVETPAPRPDLGQGRREPRKVTGADAGADLFAARRRRSVAP